MWELLCGTPPYPHTKVLSVAVEVIQSQTRPYVLQWFPRPLQILMQRCWQEIPDFRPSFEDIKNELELFEQELMENDHFGDSLISMASKPIPKPITNNTSTPPSTQTQSTVSSKSGDDDDNDTPRTKERLRSLEELVDDYLDPDRYHWDRLIRPKLQKLIREYDEAHDPSLLLAQINTMHNERHSEMVVSGATASGNGSAFTPPTMLRKNVSLRDHLSMDNKRMSTELSFTPIRPGTL